VDLDFGHGFIPRIGEENYKAVDRCVGPTDLFSFSLDLPWAIVDGAWAERKPDLLATMREHGTKVLVDTHGWRYRYDSALGVEKLRSASWAPSSAVSPGGSLRTLPHEALADVTTEPTHPDGRRCPQGTTGVSTQPRLSRQLTFVGSNHMAESVSRHNQCGTWVARRP